MLAGFSQGGAVALHTGLRHGRTLAGIMGLSTYLPLADSLDSEANTENRDTRIFVAHGTMDPVLPFDLGDRSRMHLQDRGYPVEWHTYPIMHGVSPDEVRDIAVWLNTVLAV